MGYSLWQALRSNDEESWWVRFHPVGSNRPCVRRTFLLLVVWQSKYCQHSEFQLRTIAAFRYHYDHLSQCHNHQKLNWPLHYRFVLFLLECLISCWTIWLCHRLLFLPLLWVSHWKQHLLVVAHTLVPVPPMYPRVALLLECLISCWTIWLCHILLFLPLLWVAHWNNTFL